MKISECEISENLFIYFDIYICAVFLDVYSIRRCGREKTYTVSFFIAIVCDYYSPYHFLHGRSVIFFLLSPIWSYRERRERERKRGREGERGWRKIGKSADKRVRFIASLILFIDTRIALRLRSQRLRRRNLVVKLGRVKTRLALFTRAILPPTLVHLFRACR